MNHALSYPAIRTKADMYPLFRRGAFGNRLQTWTMDEYRRSSFAGKVSLRTISTPGIQLPFYAEPLDREEVDAVGYHWDVLFGIRDAQVIVMEVPPDDRLLVQGEVVRGIFGLEFRYSTAKNIALRHAMKDAKRATGAAALAILTRYLTPSSWEDLQAVLDTWDGHVVEVAAWEPMVGDIPGRNAVIFEVRGY